MATLLGLITAIALLLSSSYVITDVKPNPEVPKIEVATTGETLVSFRYGDDINALEDALDNGDTVQLECLSGSVGGIASIQVKDEALIKDLYAALAQARVGKQSDITYTDSDDAIIFTLEDGTEFSFGFNHRRYEAGTSEIFELQNDGALWKVWSEILEYSEELEQFYFTCGSFFGGMYEYTVYEKDGVYYLKAEGSNGIELDVPEEPLSDEELWELMYIIDTHRLMRWDGFVEYDPDVLDGDEFTMDIALKGGASMHAHGYMRYPDGYGAAEKELMGLFTKIYME